MDGKCKSGGVMLDREGIGGKERYLVCVVLMWVSGGIYPLLEWEV